jgi:hypothetical protein
MLDKPHQDLMDVKEYSSLRVPHQTLDHCECPTEHLFCNVVAGFKLKADLQGCPHSIISWAEPHELPDLTSRGAVIMFPAHRMIRTSECGPAPKQQQ